MNKDTSGKYDLARYTDVLLAHATDTGVPIMSTARLTIAPGVRGHINIEVITTNHKAQVTRHQTITLPRPRVLEVIAELQEALLHTEEIA